MKTDIMQLSEQFIVSKHPSIPQHIYIFSIATTTQSITDCTAELSRSLAVCSPYSRKVSWYEVQQAELYELCHHRLHYLMHKLDYMLYLWVVFIFEWL